MPNRPILPSDFETRYPGASPTATESAMNLAFTADLLVGRIAALLKPFNLSPSTGLALGILADSPSPLPPNEIADRLILTRATMTGLLDSLERRGYVTRRPHPSDRRMLLVEITDEGRRVAQEFRLVVHRNQRLWFNSLTQGEQSRLLTYLHKLQDALVVADRSKPTGNPKHQRVEVA